MTRKDDKGDQPSGGETTWTNTGATRYGRGQHKTGQFDDDDDSREETLFKGVYSWYIGLNNC